MSKARPKAATRLVQAAPDDGLLVMDLLNRVCPGPSWRAWGAVLRGLFALPMSDDEAAIFKQGTARESLPTVPARECWVVAGRRSGKSRIAAVAVVFLAAIRQWRMAPGERPMVLLIGPSRRQAAVVLSYATAMIEMLPGVTIARKTADEVELSTGVTIRIESASFRTPRGFSIVGVVADEIAFWRDESGACPDVEILRAVRPPLASVAGALLIAISSPYSTKGALHATYERHYGRADSDVLVWQSDSRTLNPTLPQRLIDQAMDEDPSSASAEWLGLFRSDLESLFSREALAAVVVPKRFELRPMPGHAFVGFCDPSGGSSDSFTLAIGHRDVTGKAVLDLLREQKPPFSPEAVVLSFAADLKRYGCRAVYSDAYGGAWVAEQFSKAGITVTLSPLVRSEIYLEALPLVNSGACELLDHPRLINQLASLERRVGRSGKDSVDHARGSGSHDDCANACMGSLTMAVRSVGLKAALPATFTECVNPGQRCAFLNSSPWFPLDNGHCGAHCIGLRAVRASYLDHRKHAAAVAEPILTGIKFLEQRFDLGVVAIHSQDGVATGAAMG